MTGGNPEMFLHWRRIIAKDLCLTVDEFLEAVKEYKEKKTND